MGKPTIQQVAGSIVDPMLSDNYQFEIPNVPGNAGASKPLLLQCKSATKPGMTIEAVEAALYGHTIEYAGRHTYGHDLSVTYIESKDGKIITIFEDWAELERGHLTQHGAYKAEYATTSYLTIFDQKGNIVRKYKIEGTWCSAVPDISFDGSNASIIEHQITFKYDWVERMQ